MGASGNLVQYKTDCVMFDPKHDGLLYQKSTNCPYCKKATLIFARGHKFLKRNQIRLADATAWISITCECEGAKAFRLTRDDLLRSDPPVFGQIVQLASGNIQRQILQNDEW